MGRLADKVAIVTGGATGIGEAVCRRFAEEGAAIAVFDVNAELGKATAEAIRSAGGRASFFRVDVSSEADVAAAVEKVFEEFSKIDILVNNAAITGSKNIAHELDVAEWDRIFSVNVRGYFLCSKHVLKHMITAKSGSIVNVSSVYSLIGNDDIPSYHATKGAVSTMTKTDAVCYAPYGIRVNAVYPGTTLTPLVRQVGEAFPGGLDAYLAMSKAKHPLCLGEPVDVANAMLFLASDEARFVTGAALAVDGGYSASR